MSCPPRVTKTNAMLVSRPAIKLHPLNAVTTESIRRGEFCSHKFAILVYCYDAAGIITSRLQDLQSLYADISRNWSVSNVANNTAAFVGCLRPNQRDEDLLEGMSILDC